MEKYDRQAAAFIERAYQAPEIIHQRMRTLSALALTAGERVLDAGCGTGLLLEQQANAVGPTGYAAGVDFSEDMLAVARRRCGELSQVDLRQGSLENLDFDDAAFDAVSSTQTLLYVEDLNAALAELRRVLGPGARLAIIETDWRGAVFNHPDLDMTRRLFDSLDDSRPNPYLVRQLRPLLKSLGFTSVRVEAIPLLNAGYSDNNFSAGMIENMLSTARRKNYVDDAEAAAWRKAYQDLKSNDEYFFCVNRFLFTAVKQGQR